jgi:hypothetical protein
LTNETGLGRQAETRSRSIRIRNLPPATQEGLLQQALEKHALVKRVDVIQDSNEAVVELENPAVSPLLLSDYISLVDLLTGGREIAATDRASGVQRHCSANIGRDIKRAITITPVCAASQNRRAFCAQGSRLETSGRFGACKKSRWKTNGYWLHWHYTIARSWTRRFQEDVRGFVKCHVSSTVNGYMDAIFGWD